MVPRQLGKWILSEMFMPQIVLNAADKSQKKENPSPKHFLFLECILQTSLKHPKNSMGSKTKGPSDHLAKKTNEQKKRCETSPKWVIVHQPTPCVSVSTSPATPLEHRSCFPGVSVLAAARVANESEAKLSVGCLGVLIWFSC